MLFEINDSSYQELELEVQEVVIRMIANMMTLEPQTAEQVHQDFCLDLKTNLKNRGIKRKMSVVLNYLPEKDQNFPIDRFHISLTDMSVGNLLTITGVLQEEIKRTYSEDIN